MSSLDLTGVRFIWYYDLLAGIVFWNFGQVLVWLVRCGWLFFCLSFIGSVGRS